jgi:hypothetical protein
MLLLDSGFGMKSTHPREGTTVRSATSRELSALEPVTRLGVEWTGDRGKEHVTHVATDPFLEGARREVKARRDFLYHLMVLVLINALLVFIDLSGGRGAASSVSTWPTG